MSFARSNATPRARLRQAAWFQVEGLERRVLLSSAIAAFNPQQAFPTGTNPLALAVADVNRDGKLDLIVANNTDGNVG
ncbi:MAG TPA: VCBS repeat-containing protein, partial [Tepidisphaeraceae bacterium]|nr:VCBS repeat-containing protein [Tepidisphaeraceae bacterium]